MEALKGKDSVQIPANILNGALRFIDTKDHVIFGDKETSNPDDAVVKDHKVDFITTECVDLNSNPGLLYSKIDDLANLSASLDKYLTECSDKRYNDLMNTSLYMNFRSKMSTISLVSIKNLRRCFDDYKYSSVHNGADVIRIYQRLERMHEIASLMNTVKTLHKLYEYTRNSKLGRFHSIFLLASVLYHLETVSRVDSRISSTIIFNTIKEKLTYSCSNLIKGVFLKSGNQLDLQEKAKLLLLLGKSPGDAAKYLLEILQTELISISSFVLQKYITADRFVNLSQNESFSHRVGPRDISLQARMIGSNVLLLTICRLLSDYISFFKKLFSELVISDEDISFLTKNLDSFSKLYHIPAEVIPTLSKLNNVQWKQFYFHICTLIKRDISHLVSTTFEILATILHNCDLGTLHDAKDIIKIALLLRFYIIYHNIHRSCASSSQLDEFGPMDHEDEIKEIITILRTSENVLSCNHKSNTDALNTLEAVISTKLDISLRNNTKEDFAHLETFDRIKHVPPGAFQDIFSATRHFTHVILENQIITADGTKLSLANPYQGWTPNTAFTGFNLNVYSHGNHYNPDSPYNSALNVNYGGVFTASSKKLTEYFGTFYNVMLVQPENALEVVTKFTNMVDKFIYRSITSCGVHTSVIETLEKFKILFKAVRDENPRICKFSSISTTSSIDGNTTSSIARNITSSIDRNTGTNVISCTLVDISQLYSCVNAIESCFTLLEYLRVFVENNTGEVQRVLQQYYEERLGIIAELRSVVYYISMYSLLREKLPTIKILKSLKMVDARAKIRFLFAEFEKHLNDIQKSLAGTNSPPITVKIHLWGSATRAIKDSFKPILDVINNDINCHVQEVVNDGYTRALKVADAARRFHIDTVKRDYLSNKTEIANMGTYHIMVNEIINSY